MINRFIVLFWLMTFSNTSFAVGTAACSMSELEPGEICHVSNPATKHLSLRKLDIDEMRGFDNLSSDEQNQLIAQVNSHNKTRDKIDKIHSRLGEMIFSSFVIIFLVVISTGSSMGEYFRVGKQTKGADGLIVGLFTAVCLGAAFDARSGGYGARELRDYIEVKLEVVRQTLAYNAIESTKSRNTLELADQQAVLDQQKTEVVDKISFNSDLSRFLLNVALGYYRTNTVMLENEMDYQPESASELSEDLKVLHSAMIIPIYKSFKYEEKSLKMAEAKQSKVASYQLVELEESTIEKNAGKYVAGYEIRSPNQKLYGKASFKDVLITSDVVLKNVDFEKFIAGIKEGKSYGELIEPAIKPLVDYLAAADGSLTNNAQNVILTTATNLAHMAKAELAYKVSLNEIDNINSMMVSILEAHCIDNPALVQSSKDYLDDQIGNSKAMSCLANEGGSIKLLGLDLTGEVYSAKSKPGEKQNHQDSVISDFQSKMESAEIKMNTEFYQLYKEFINYQREVLGSEENEDFFVSRGGAQFGGFLSQKIMESTFDYAEELQSSLNLNSISNEHFMIFKDEDEQKRIAPDLYLEAATMINKNFVGSKLREVDTYRENKEFTYENIANQQMDAKQSTDVSIVEATNSAGLDLISNLSTRLISGMSSIYKIDFTGEENGEPEIDKYRTPIGAFKETVKDTKGMVQKALDQVVVGLIYVYSAKLVTDMATSFSDKDKAAIKDNSKKANGLKKSINIADNIAGMATSILLAIFMFLVTLLMILVFIVKVVLEAPNLIFGLLSLTILVASIQIMLLPYLMGLFAFVGYSRGEKVMQMKLVGLFLIMGFMLVTGSFFVAAIGMLLYNPMVIILGMASEMIIMSINDAFAEGGVISAYIGMIVSVLIVITSSLGYMVFIMRFFWKIVAQIIAEVPAFDNQVDLFGQVKDDINAISKIEQLTFRMAMNKRGAASKTVQEMNHELNGLGKRTVDAGVDAGYKVADKGSKLGSKVRDKLSKKEEAPRETDS